jgi:hypothetical protein
MATIYDITYSKVILNLLPPHWRQAIHIAWLNCLVKPMQWVRDWFYDCYIYTYGSYYCEPTTGNLYLNGALKPGASTIANKNDNVKFIDNSLWQCLTDGTDCSVDNPILTPTSANWKKLQADCFGMFDRQKFNAQKIVLEYVLNAYFNPLNYTDKIYIVNATPIDDTFIGDKTNATDPQLSDKDSPYSFFNIGDMAAVFLSYSYTIYVPVQIATDLGADYEKIIRTKNDKYNVCSIIYQII